MLDGPRGLRPGSCGGPGHTPDYRGGCGTAVVLIIAVLILIFA